MYGNKLFGQKIDEIQISFLEHSRDSRDINIQLA
jgi:hypothetical protein